MSKLLVNCCLSVIFFYGLVETDSDGLISVVVIFRHGDRTPIRAYKNDPYQDEIWPLGYGQLTDDGKDRHYRLGRWFRQKYENFLPKRCLPGVIKIISSEYNRTILSATSHITGLFLADNQTWDPQRVTLDSEWPCQIEKIPRADDPIISQTKSCPKHDRLYQQLLKNRNFRNFFKDNRNLFQYLSRSSGENITSFLDVAQLYGILQVEKSNNLTLPVWAEAVYPTIQQIANFSWAVNSYTNDMARLNAGPLIDTITSFFETSLNDSTSSKYLILSGHDYTIISFLDTFGIYDYLWPEYASSLIFELRQGENDEPFINIFYKNSTYVKNIILPGCDFDCEFKNFQKLVTPYRLDMDTWEKECINSKEDT